MNKVCLNFALSLAALTIMAQSTQHLTGAWGRDHNGSQQTLVFAGNFWSFTEFNIANKEFSGTAGGSYTFDGSVFKATEEYNTMAGADYQSPLQGKVNIEANELHIGSSDWKRIDDGSPGKLPGAWLITGRKRDGEIVTRTPGVRKTMKILSGTRFQWIAYNSETMEFHGTGGGSYTTSDGKYSENIEFFSRDSSRVGASLEFNFELIDGAWHHSGNSSRGKPIYEIWSLRE